MAGEPIVVESRMSAVEYRSLLLRRAFRSPLFFVVVAVVLAAEFVAAGGVPRTAAGLAGRVVVAVGVAAGVMAVSAHIQAHARRARVGLSEMRFAIDEEGVSQTSALGSGRNRWEDLAGWGQDGEFVLLWIGRSVFVPVRVSVLSREDRAAVEELLHRNLGAPRR